MEKLLTIIIPTYNMEKYIDKCLASLIIPSSKGGDAMMRLLEVLVINDGSTDSSSEIAHSYVADYPDVFRVVDKENGNYGSCINVALKMATGKYVKVLDADDYFDTDAFLLYLTELQTVDADLVLTYAHTVNPEGELTSDMTLPLEPYKIQPIEMLVPVTSLLAMHLYTYRLRILKDINYHQTEGVSHTDTEWMAIPLIGVDTIYCIPVFLYQYLLGRKGQTVDRDSMSSNFESIIQMVFRLGNVWQNYNGEKIKKQILYNLFVRTAKVPYSCQLRYNPYPESSFRDFDDALTVRFPFLRPLTESSFIVGGRICPFKVVKLWRERRMLLYKLGLLRYKIGGWLRSLCSVL